MTSPTEEQVEAARMDRRARIDAAAGSLPAYLATATQEELERLIWDSQHQRNVFGFFKGMSSDHARDICSEIARRAALTAASEREGWRPTHQHRKGGLYKVIAEGRMEATLAPVVIYQARNGTTWVRPADEFNDGRFRTISSLPTPPAPDVGREG